MSNICRDTFTRMLASLTYGERQDIIDICTTLNKEHERTSFVARIEYRRCTVYVKRSSIEQTYNGTYDDKHLGAITIEEDDLVAVDALWWDNRLITVRLALLEAHWSSGSVVPRYSIVDHTNRVPPVERRWLTINIPSQDVLDRLQKGWLALQSIDPETLEPTGL